MKHDHHCFREADWLHAQCRCGDITQPNTDLSDRHMFSAKHGQINSLELVFAPASAWSDLDQAITAHRCGGYHASSCSRADREHI